MQLPRWLRIISVLVALNAVLVFWSVLQHHVLASAGTQEAPIENDSAGSTEIPGPNETGDGPQPTLVPPVLQEVVHGTVPENDPLMKEIRRQATSQFGEISDADQSYSAVVASRPSASQSSRATVDELQLLQLRLQVVTRMSQAAQQLSEMVALQKQLGQQEQAEASLLRIQHLTDLIRESLSE